jgi:subtilisin family serine protease
MRGRLWQAIPWWAARTYFADWHSRPPSRQEIENPPNNGTSAACPVAAGVVALLMSAFPDATPQALGDALIEGANGSGWSPDTGHGVIHAGASVARLPIIPGTVKRWLITTSAETDLVALRDAITAHGGAVGDDPPIPLGERELVIRPRAATTWPRSCSSTPPC